MTKEDNFYDDRHMIPADNVDANGTTWVTVGENIRHGSNGTPNKEEALEMLSTLLGVKLSYEEVTCTLTPNKAVSTDNHNFIGTTDGITSVKQIVSYFVLNNNTTGGSTSMTYYNLKGKLYILLQASSNPLTGTIKLGVLLA